MSFIRSVRNMGQSTTEVKVKKATDDDEYSGATGALMNEISVLTYSTKTLREITQVIHRRLSGNYRKSSHRNAVHTLKTLTLISYLINNGSNDFVSWIRQYAYLVDTLREFNVSADKDRKMAEQVRMLSIKLSKLLKDDLMLQERRRELTQFRSSISTPGRKSTDNSHLKVHHPNKPNHHNTHSNGYYDYVAKRNTKSLDIKGTPRHSLGNQPRKFPLGPLTEEEDVEKENNATDSNAAYESQHERFYKRRGITRLVSNNPFL